MDYMVEYGARGEATGDRGWRIRGRTWLRGAALPLAVVSPCRIRGELERRVQSKLSVSSRNVRAKGACGV